MPGCHSRQAFFHRVCRLTECGSPFADIIKMPRRRKLLPLRARCDAIPSPEQSWGNFKELVSLTALLSQSRAGLRDCLDAVPNPPYEFILSYRLMLKHYFKHVVLDISRSSCTLWCSLIILRNPPLLYSPPKMALPCHSRFSSPPFLPSFFHSSVGELRTLLKGFIMLQALHGEFGFPSSEPS